ncbi:MAG: hypothetical protein ACR652_14065 [Methylocystis sp.]|uniref:hypothetical protein n=1 Tax=Methylocystis sp. TaxID=1911079 RepID=UPI003DA5CD4A
MSSFFMPVFRHHSDEGAIIGRIITGYGELEFVMSLCVGEALNDRDLAMRVLFSLKSESARIDLGESLSRNEIKANGLEASYFEAVAAMRYCRALRNQYAHSHWAFFPKEGVFFSNMEEAASSGQFLEGVMYFGD